MCGCFVFPGGKGLEEAAENRNYLSGRMTEEVNEVIRVLQLTTYDEDEWNSDNVTVMRKAVNAIENDLRNAHDWIKVRSPPLHSLYFIHSSLSFL